MPDFRKASLFKDSGATRVREPYDYGIGRRTGDKICRRIETKADAQDCKMPMIGARINACAAVPKDGGGMKVDFELGMKPCHALPCSTLALPIVK